VSDALKFLTQARPEAMGHYFAFLKDCGKHLSPETRCLISVITKVDAQTERGFKQYLKRALAEGCTPAQVLDALLMAFPTLGLTKIVWAVDLALAMDLPGFDALALAPPVAVWHDVMPTKGFKTGHTQRLVCEGRALFVHRASAKDWLVYDSRCPHQATDMSPDALQGQQLTCSKHGWTFDVRSGGCTAVGDRGLTRWPHRVVKGRLLAQW
jgi:nitrite reductase/ring-hydroxylating ferredoxin subunit/alkylhydroperoxidase/carboxymuconolactone decarboxylase family protein YurZ